jgi:uncharacterized protein YecA (UPF0149 family)
MPDADPFDLNRFVTAQAPVFAAALDELRAGRKRSHWMWFIFPQLRGLGHSAMAEFYGTVIAADWAEGFLHAVALRADAWEPLMRSRRHGRLLFPILALCADEHGDSAHGLEPDEEDRVIVEAAELIPVCVTEIAAYWRKRRPTQAMGSSQPVSVSLKANQPGRNDPCPCGSGRKFKVCCGRLH